MRWFGGSSLKDREHLVQTLHSLGTTSVGGLSAALSWSERRTRKALDAAVRWGEGAIEFDPVRRSVSLHASAPPAIAPPVAALTVPAEIDTTVAPPALPKSWGASARCPTCQVVLSPTGSGNGYYCPQCGRLSAMRSASTSATPSTPVPSPSPSVPPKRSVPSNPEPVVADRRSQELFAAWVTERPIPCPKCRTTLRHHGVAEYACPSCGHRVSFERSASLPSPTGPRAEPPPLPNSPAN